MEIFWILLRAPPPRPPPAARGGRARVREEEMRETPVVNSTKSQENVAEVLLNERGIVGITCKFH